MAYYLLEAAFIFLGALLIVTQMILPPFIGKPFWWILKKREQILSGKEDELNAVKIDSVIADAEIAIAEAKEEVEAKIKRKYTRKKATNNGNDTP
jgi:hypothetical protein